jgi:alkylation response protein AidB-like acyl-CoA dehydrogenase
MDFRVDDHQRELAEGIRSMLAGRLPLEHLREREGDELAISASDWQALGETGVFALTLPEPAGTGLGLADAVVVFEELGRALVPGPLVGTFLAASAGLVDGAAEGRCWSSTWGRSTRCSSSTRTARASCCPPCHGAAHGTWSIRSTR